MSIKISGITDVLKNIDKFDGRLRTAAGSAGELTAIQVAQAAKQGRNWTDRTNQARNGLTGTSEQVGDRVTVALAHRVSYGVWLELANAGRFAVIQRTIDEHRQVLQDNVKRLVRI